MIKREFFVDEICYVLELIENNIIIFYIDIHKSKGIGQLEEWYDPFASFEETKEFIEYTYDLVNTEIKHFFQIKKVVLNFIEEIANRGTNYFSFDANEERKMNIYRKVSEKVAAKYGYYLYEIGSSFQFYKALQD